MIKSTDLGRAGYLVKKIETLDLFLEKFPNSYDGIRFEPRKFGSETYGPSVYIALYPPDLGKDLSTVLSDTVLSTVRIYRERLAKELKDLGVELENE